MSELKEISTSAIPERSGDYGAAIRGDDPTTAWAAPTGLGETEAPSYPADTMNKVALTFGGILLVALVLLCFRLGFDGSKPSGDAKEPRGKSFAGTASYAGPGAPVGRVDSSSHSVPLPAAPVVNLPPPANNAPPAIVHSALFASNTERNRVLNLLSDCRSAYDASGELSQKWFSAADAAKSVERLDTAQAKAAEESSIAQTVLPDSPHILSGKEWDSIDTQIEAIASTIGLATQPARYPLALQDTTTELRREMQTYLQTARAALVQTDPEKRATFQARASTHRQKAGQLLSVLESSVKSSVLPTGG